MPTIPPCPPDVPEVLNPLNLGHYGMLLKWLYFQPSKLKHYLYRLDPNLYQARGRALFTTIRQPAYQRLYSMSLVATVMLSAAVVWAASAAQTTTPRWELWALGVALGVAGGVAWVIGVTRGMFHLLEWPLAVWPGRNGPPAYWDELTVWPWPWSDRWLQQQLDRDFGAGLAVAAHIAANPFQRWAVQRTLSSHLAAHPAPLTALYQIAQAPALEAYLFMPVTRRQWRDVPSARLVLLGEIGQRPVDGTGGTSETSERLVWRMTRRLRHNAPTPIMRFSAALYEVLRAETQMEPTDSDVRHLSEEVTAGVADVRRLPHGVEVVESFVTLNRFLVHASSLDDLAQAPAQLAWLDELVGPPLRPKVLDALRALGDIGAEVAVNETATSVGQKSAALNRAAGLLNELAGFVKDQVLPPERLFLARVVESWQSLIAEAQGRLGQAALLEMSPAMRREAGIPERQSAVWSRPALPFGNPYVVGKPVAPPLFVGRVDVLNRIGEVWSAKAVPDSIILYGHRRMGKSSILRNLDQVAPAEAVIVGVDMMGEAAFVASTADLLLGLADRIRAAVYTAAPKAAPPAPSAADYDTPAHAQRSFNRLLEAIRTALAGRVLILAVDEFEKIQDAVEAGKIGADIYPFLRAKVMEGWWTLVLGGLHTLDEMSRDYYQPFHGSYENILVSYLAPADARRLITNPAPDFNVNYEPAAVDRIIAETGGQPYLIQQLCRDALDHLNHELFDEQKDREVRITLRDVEAVLGPGFFTRGTVYFDGVWSQTNHPGQRRLLRIAARRGEPWPEADLFTASELIPPAFQAALLWAERHDILTKAGVDGWGFHVPLLRRWINERAVGEGL